MSNLKPEDFNVIKKGTKILVLRANDKDVIDECCGIWKFLNINEDNEVIMSSLKNKKDIWALEWYHKKNNNGCGWFPYSEKKYPLRNIEYIILINDNLSQKDFNSAVILNNLI